MAVREAPPATREMLRLVFDTAALRKLGQRLQDEQFNFPL